ncbi:MAG: ATP-grasp domain-containing protein [Pseudomonadota bacterium]|nr:ATP-grasp domain-containing protein [Pseudomonadota bacterium]
MQVAIVGCGQLARMLALAGLPMGMRFSFLALPGESTAPVDGLGRVVVATPDLEPTALYEQLGQPQRVTAEKEQLPIELLRGLAPYTEVHPNPEAIYQCQHRLREKATLEACQVPFTPYRAIHEERDLWAAGEALGWPLLLKHTQEGYDGKAQWRLTDEAAARQWLQGPAAGTLGPASGQWLAEPIMPFEREVSLLAVRGREGHITFYDPAQNRHRQGILVSSLAPAPDLPAGLLPQMQAALQRLQTHLDYVGVLAMECFIKGDQWWVNELAPRVHNSGHWSQQTTAASQFENHLRAVAGWPLGDTELQGAAAMLNLLGVPVDQHTMLADGASLNWYNKTVRPDRKVGHIVLRGPALDEVRGKLNKLQSKIYGPDF